MDCEPSEYITEYIMTDEPVESSGRSRKLERKWTAAENKILVEMVEEREAIWNCCSTLYRDRELRCRSFEEIAAKTCHSVSDVKTHWNTVKSRFNAERKKELTSKSGQGGSTYKSKYDLYMPLQFLLKVGGRPPGGTATNLASDLDETYII